MSNCVSLPGSLKEGAISKPLRVVLTGSECTGKSTLADMLAAHYEVPCVHEFLRDYFIDHDGVLTLDDAIPIVKGQLASEDSVETAVSDADIPVMLFDTNALSSVVYNKYYYGTNPEWIEQAFADRNYTLYFLCGIDVPWQADGQRDRPQEREYLQSLFRNELIARDLPFIELNGDVTERFSHAVSLIDLLLKNAC